jgi:hypothetical protein
VQFKDVNAKVVYLYFDYKAKQTQTATDVARTLLKQLISQSEAVLPELEGLYEQATRDNTEPDFTTLIQLLKTSSQNLHFYAVFDAMDECADGCQEGILALFAELQKSGWRLLISCRPHTQTVLEKSGGMQIFEIMANESDLKNYILARLKKENNNNAILEKKCLGLAKEVKGM